MLFLCLFKRNCHDLVTIRTEFGKIKKVLTECILIIHRLWYNRGKMNRKKRLYMEKYYEIKVTIRESHPPTWRRLRIPADITFNDLAAIIEIAFEWCGYHLYEFEVGSTLHEMGQFIGVPMEDEYDIESIRGKTLDSGKERIDK